MDEKVPIVAAQLAGEFILPNDKTKNWFLWQEVSE